MAANLWLIKWYYLRSLGDAFKKIRYWCQDETRLGLKTIPRRKLTAYGVKPIGKVQWEFKAFYLYGVVEPKTGEFFLYEFSHLDSDCFQRFLNLLSERYPNDLHIIQLDNGRFHKAKKIRVPANIILLFQPAHSPDLNPIERLWQDIKDNLSWGEFRNLDDLRSKVGEIVNSLKPSSVTSLTGWDYILDALCLAEI